MIVKIFLHDGAIEDAKVVRETQSYIHIVEGGKSPRHLLVPWQTIRFVEVKSQTSKLGE